MHLSELLICFVKRILFGYNSSIIICRYLSIGGFVANYIHKIARIHTWNRITSDWFVHFFPPPLTELIDCLSIHSSRPMINHRKSIFFLSSAFVFIFLYIYIYIDLLSQSGARLTPYSLLLRLSAVLFVQRDYFNMDCCHARATANNLQFAARFLQLTVPNLSKTSLFPRYIFMIAYYSL